MFDRDSWQEILSRPAVDQSGLRDGVSDLLNQVKSGGDKTLFELTRRFDGIELTDLQV